MELTEMPLSQLSENVSNPRTITDTKLERLVESILVFPRMLSLRPIVVDENNVILGGNMRFRALSRISSMKFPTLKKTLSGSGTFTKRMATNPPQHKTINHDYELTPRPPKTTT